MSSPGARKGRSPVTVRHESHDDAQDASGEDAGNAAPKHVSQALAAATESAAAPKAPARVAAAPTQ